jgi:hypothetical protein
MVDLPRDHATPFALDDLRRAGTILSELGGLWNHPGVSDEKRKALVEEVFEQIQIDELGIRVVKPAADYLPLMAVASWGEIAGETPVSRSITRFPRNAPRSDGPRFAHAREAANKARGAPTPFSSTGPIGVNRTGAGPDSSTMSCETSSSPGRA